MGKMNIRLFNGLEVDKHPLAIGEQNSPGCSNVSISTPYGKVVNEIGFEKKYTLGAGNSITAIHQLPRWDGKGFTTFWLQNGKWSTGVPTSWTTYGTYGTGVGNFYRPYGIFYDSSTEYIYIADRSNHRIVKTKIDGTGWTTYGTLGTGVGNFEYPAGIFYDSSYLYIADWGNDRIVKINEAGAFP